MLERALAVIGPPGSGKTTLTMQLGELPGCRVFRLREQVPEIMLAATATNPERLGCFDDLTVTRALRGYIQSAAGAGTHTVLMDDFPGSDTQAHLLLWVLRKLAPACIVHAAELVAAPAVLRRRVRARRVCHQCERDPIHDPCLPANPSPTDPWRCARCNGILHPRRGDAPRLLTARMQCFDRTAIGIRTTFANAGIEVLQLDVDHEPERLVSELSLLLAAGITPV